MAAALDGHQPAACEDASSQASVAHSLKPTRGAAWACLTLVLAEVAAATTVYLVCNAHTANSHCTCFSYLTRLLGV